MNEGREIFEKHFVRSFSSPVPYTSKRSGPQSPTPFIDTRCPVVLVTGRPTAPRRSDRVVSDDPGGSDRPRERSPYHIVLDPNLLGPVGPRGRSTTTSTSLKFLMSQTPSPVSSTLVTGTPLNSRMTGPLCRGTCSVFVFLEGTPFVNIFRLTPSVPTDCLFVNECLHFSGRVPQIRGVVLSTTHPSPVRRGFKPRDSRFYVYL